MTIKKYQATQETNNKPVEIETTDFGLIKSHQKPHLRRSKFGTPYLAGKGIHPVVDRTIDRYKINMKGKKLVGNWEFVDNREVENSKTGNHIWLEFEDNGSFWLGHDEYTRVPNSVYNAFKKYGEKVLRLKYYTEKSVEDIPALEGNLHDEVKAIAQYDHDIENSTDPKTKELLEHIKKEEEQHKKELEEAIESNKKTGKTGEIEKGYFSELDIKRKGKERRKQEKEDHQGPHARISKKGKPFIAGKGNLRIQTEEEKKASIKRVREGTKKFLGPRTYTDVTHEKLEEKENKN